MSRVRNTLKLTGQTHGGISTPFECVLTEIPTVMFPLEGDQPHTALFGESHYQSLVTPLTLCVASERGIDIELMQVRTGMGVGLPTMRGITPTDDKATRREEMTDDWTWIRGEEGEVMRGKVREMKEVVVESWRQGESYRAMRSFAKWIESADNS